MPFSFKKKRKKVNKNENKNENENIGDIMIDTLFKIKGDGEFLEEYFQGLYDDKMTSEHYKNLIDKSSVFYILSL